MKITVERDALVDGLNWVSRSLSTRPIQPVLLGIRMKAAQGSLHLAAYDQELSGEASVIAQIDSPGEALVSGRLFTEVIRSLPHKPVTLHLDGARFAIECGSSRFALPTMNADEYPNLPELPESSGDVSGSLFAEAIAQVAVAAGRDDSLPVLTGVHIEIEDDRVTLAATDRYRLAVREFNWNAQKPNSSANALVRGRTLAEVAKSLSHSEKVTIALAPANSDKRLVGFEIENRATTSRMLDGAFPPYRHLLPSEASSVATIEVAALMEAVRRVAVVVDKTSSLKLTFSDNSLKLEARSTEEAQATEEIPLEFEGDEISIAFNPTFLTDGLTAVGKPFVRIAFTASNKPAVLSGKSAADGVVDESYRYLLMPMRY